VDYVFARHHKLDLPTEGEMKRVDLVLRTLMVSTP
jgi:hypothetical protein